MVDVVSIVIAVVSLIGSLASAGFTGWISFYIEEHKRRTESKALTNKYRDPLTLSAFDLQSRLFGLVDGNLLVYLLDDSKRALVKSYTAFLVGQYFSWVYIFRRQAQFLRFSTDTKNKELNRIMDSITKEFIDDTPREELFMLWKGQQMAIGEVMTLCEDGQLYCMGFAQFTKRYEDDEDFRQWFKSIDEDILFLDQAIRGNNLEAANKLRRLQHLLIDLVSLLDVSIIASAGYAHPKVHGAQRCRCNDCPGKTATSVLVAGKQNRQEQA
ncbi:hypothetical protein PRZ48_014832 [Zasmidium cellare]|uniref:Uncharacterized protein n=1 Tax=Zasmidium cellare TaxID=395010 RepID=A0ABR0DWU1_ZASCE|nr:hypothetical protein PRZ48_014832 [Zasmidium cellare]